MDPLAIDRLPASVARRVMRRSLARGEALFHQGDAAAAIFLVERGQVALTRHLAHGAAVVVHRARAGESFAEAALFAERYHCDAIAESATRVAAIPKRPLLAALARDQALAGALMARLARQVQSLRARLEIRAVRPACERVFQALALAATRGRVVLDRPLKELAAEIGLTHEALYRALAALAASGRLERTGRRIVLRGL
jgi:CRP-like cAMP-binding protein